MTVACLATEICVGPHNRLLRRQHCSSLCSQSEGHQHVANMPSALGHDFVEFLAVFGRHNIRPPHFASKVSYSASPQTFTECSRSTSCCYAAMLFGPKPRRDFLDFDHSKIIRRPAVPILFSERGTRHDRTRDEARSNAGRDAIERGRAFAIKYRDRIGSPYF